MSIKSLVDWDIPGWVGLEQFNHVTLQVPDYYLGLEAAVSLTAGMPLICAL
jgi:hypothetical protein